MKFDLGASLATLDTTEGHTQHYNGTAIWKSADDMRRYEVILSDPVSRPDLLIETGTRWGGFALWAADRFDIDVLTIDVDRARGDVTRHPRVTCARADSADPVTVLSAADFARGRRAMVTLDADHHAPHVQAEIRGYARLVSPGCFLVIEDTIADLSDAAHARQIGARIPEEGGPLAALDSERAMLADLGFAPAVDIEHLSPITHSPGGWWRRA